MMMMVHVHANLNRGDDARCKEDGIDDGCETSEQVSKADGWTRVSFGTLGRERRWSYRVLYVHLSGYLRTQRHTRLQLRHFLKSYARPASSAPVVQSQSPALNNPSFKCSFRIIQIQASTTKNSMIVMAILGE